MHAPTIKPAKSSALSCAIAAIALVIGLTAPAVTHADGTITTVPRFFQSPETYGPFGEGGLATIGETVTVPAGDESLHSFTIYLNVTDDLHFRAFVYRWDVPAQEARGTALYESEDLETEGDGMEPVTIDTGSIPVIPGEQYVLFFSISHDEGVDSENLWEGPMGATDGSPYSEGEIVSENNGYSTAQWTTAEWTAEPDSDLAFEASFSPAGPSITSVTPATVTPGSRVTIKGTHLGGVTEVLFGGIPATSFTEEGEEEISAVVPTGWSGTTDIRVVTGGGESAAVEGDRVTYTPPSTPTATAANVTTPAAPVACVVPAMRGMSLKAAAAALLAAHCKLGSVAHHHGGLPPRELLEQSLHQGTVRPAGTAVNVWLSLGPFHRSHVTR
jgi:hypothetical protein